MNGYSSAWHVRLVSCDHYVRLRKLGFFLYLGHARAYVAYDKWTLKNLGYFRTCIFWLMQMGSKCADIIHIIINTCFESTKLLMSIKLIWTWRSFDMNLKNCWLLHWIRCALRASDPLLHINLIDRPGPKIKFFIPRAQRAGRINISSLRKPRVRRHQ